jgi:hypothetical protein
MGIEVSNPYPWYDSIWLAHYQRATEILQETRPSLLADFQRAFEPLRTRSDFRVQFYDRIFDDLTMARLELTVSALRGVQLESHEANNFGRFVVHNHPYLSDLQYELVELVSEGTGEVVEPCYNFLSLYRAGAMCPVHMDAPEAKWTLDLCIRQSESWPISFSQVVPWPDDYQPRDNNWQREIRESPQHSFASCTMERANALLFAGSSQWHYRDRLPASDGGAFCDLAFFHFIPAGTGELVRPASWARLFGAPELEVLASYVAGAEGLPPRRTQGDARRRVLVGAMARDALAAG